MNIYLVFTLDHDNNSRFIKAFKDKDYADKYLDSLKEQGSRGYVTETQLE